MKAIIASAMGACLMVSAPALAGGGQSHAAVVVHSHSWGGGYHPVYRGYYGGWHGGGIGPWGWAAIGLGTAAALGAGAYALGSGYTAPAITYTYPQGPYGPPARWCSWGGLWSPC